MRGEIQTEAGESGVKKERGEEAPSEARAQGFEEMVLEALRGLPEAVSEASAQRPRRLLASVRPDGILEVCRLLKGLGFDHLSCLTCVDYESELEMVYLLWSYEDRCLVELRSRISGEEPRIRSVASVWSGAEFHEREAYDMFGVRFEGCPNLRRVLLPDDWTIFPLRKSFKVESIYERKKRREAERAEPAGSRPKEGGAP